MEILPGNLSLHNIVPIIALDYKCQVSPQQIYKPVQENSIDAVDLSIVKAIITQISIVMKDINSLKLTVKHLFGDLLIAVVPEINEVIIRWKNADLLKCLLLNLVILSPEGDMSTNGNIKAIGVHRLVARPMLKENLGQAIDRPEHPQVNALVSSALPMGFFS